MALRMVRHRADWLVILLFGVAAILTMMLALTDAPNTSVEPTPAERHKYNFPGR